MANYILVGEIGSGKDTVARFMPGHQRLALGDEIRLTANLIRSYGPNDAYKHLYKLFKAVPADLMAKLHDMARLPRIDDQDRLLLQALGTYCRLHDDQIWVRPALNAMVPDEHYVITDCRRYSELMSFQDCVSIYVYAPEHVRKQRIAERDNNFNFECFNHEAEKEIPSLMPLCRYWIDNAISLEVTEDWVKWIMFIEERRTNHD